jgi:hypothetical protein
MRENVDYRLILAEAKLTPLQRQVLSLVGEGKTDNDKPRACAQENPK